MKRSKKKWLNPTRKRLHPLTPREVKLRALAQRTATDSEGDSR